MKRSLCVVLLCVVAACGLRVPSPPAATPPPHIDVPAPAVAVLTVEVIGPPCGSSVVMVGDRSWPTRPDCTIVEEFRVGEVLGVTASAPGFVASAPRSVTMTPGRMAPIGLTLERVPVVGRRGPVRLEGYAFADDDGPWLALGTTLFWALWGERHDTDRLDRNLAFAAEHGIDYVRILSMVGAPSWEGREIDPRWPDYWEIIDRFIARARRHGLRVQVTIFADAQVMMPETRDRERWIDAWAARANREPEAFTLLETANEAWQNGFSEVTDLVALTARLNAQTAVLVAPSAASCGSMAEGSDEDWQRERAAGHLSDDDLNRRRACVDEWRAMARVADVMTPHFDRDINKADGPDRPVRQPWEMLFNPKAVGVRAYVNNEPIGPQSSVAADDDPRRLMMAAAVTWLTQGAAYTLHTGAGIRGGNAFDLARGRSANLWEVPHVTETLRLIGEARRQLPTGLPNCQPANAHWAEAPFSVDPDALIRAYQSVCADGTFVALPHGIKGASVELTARRTLEVRGTVVPAGAIVTIPSPSAIMVGRVR